MRQLTPYVKVKHIRNRMTKSCRSLLKCHSTQPCVKFHKTVSLNICLTSRNVLREPQQVGSRQHGKSVTKSTFVAIKDSTTPTNFIIISPQIWDKQLLLRVGLNLSNQEIPARSPFSQRVKFSMLPASLVVFEARGNPSPSISAMLPRCAGTAWSAHREPQLCLQS